MIVEKLYQLVTGQPYWAGQTMSEDFGPPPAVEFAAELAGLSTLDAVHHGMDIVNRARTLRRAADRTVSVG